MATTTEQLVLAISADTRAIQRQLSRLTQDTAKTTKTIEGQFDRMGSRVNASMSKLGKAGSSIGGNFIRGGVAGLAAGFTAGNFQELLDSNTRITNSLKVAGLEGEKLTQTYEKLSQIALKTHTPFEQLTTLFSRLNQSAGELGASSDDIASFSENVAKALQAGAVGGAQAESALLQLAQALGGAKVQADEFRSINEAAPTIMQAVAAGIKETGGSVAKLRQLMLDGKLSNKLFFDGLNAGSSETEKKLEGAATTIGQAFTDVGTALILAAGEFDKATGTSSKFAQFLVDGVIPAIDGVFEALTRVANEGLPQFLKAWNEFQRSQAAGTPDWVPDIGKMIKGTAVGDAIEAMGGTLGRDAILGNNAQGGRVGTGPTGTSKIFTPRMDSSGFTQNNGLPYDMRYGEARVLDASRTQNRTSPNAVSASDPKYKVDDPKAGDKAAKAAKSAADKLQKEADRAAEKFAESIGAQAKVAVDAAETLLGQSENTAGGRKNINTFLKAGGVDLDAATTAWCAAFVKSALTQVGVSGLPEGNVATSFLNFGRAVNAEETQRGDVIVQARGKKAGEEGGHVGLATGEKRFKDGIVQLEVLSGNASDKVQKDWVSAYDLVARRAVDGTAVQVDSLGNLVDKTDEVTEAQKRLQDTMQEIGSAFSSAISGFVKDIIDGKDATEALKNALGGLADKLLDMALNGLFDSLFAPKQGGGAAGGGIGGFFSSLFGLGGGGAFPAAPVLGGGLYHTGGTVGSHHSSRSLPASVWAGAPRMHNGGVAGLRAGEVPAILERGEVVTPKGVSLKGAGTKVTLNNYTTSKVTPMEKDNGKSIEVVIEERVADRINTKGTPANKAVRNASSNNLKKR